MRGEWTAAEAREGERMGAEVRRGEGNDDVLCGCLHVDFGVLAAGACEHVRSERLPPILLAQNKRAALLGSTWAHSVCSCMQLPSASGSDLIGVPCTYLQSIPTGLALVGEAASSSGFTQNKGRGHQH